MGKFYIWLPTYRQWVQSSEGLTSDMDAAWGFDTKDDARDNVMQFWWSVRWEIFQMVEKSP